MKIRSRHFNGRCAKHKRYNPGVDGVGGIRGGCTRCMMLYEIWEASIKLNQLIRSFDPRHDDTRKRKSEPEPYHDPRQMSLIVE